MRNACCSAVIAILSVFYAAHAAGATATAWKPADNVEIIVGAGPGGGNDNVARMLQKILQDRRLVEAPSTVVNKVGGGGGIAFRYLAQHKGSGNFVGVSSNTLLTNHITGVSPINYTDFTPLAIMINEYISMAVRPESPIKSGRDMIAKLKADPSSVSFGISTQHGNINHIAVAVVAKNSGIDVKKLKVAVFDSSASSITAVLGGHIDVVVGPPSISVTFIDSGKLRAIGITSPQRLRGVLATQPTWREQGVDAIVVNWRGVIGVQNLAAPQVAFWDDALGRLAKTEEWNRELERNLWENSYASSRDAGRYLKTQYEDLRRIMLELGFAK